MTAFLYNITTFKYINTVPYLQHQYSTFLHVIYNVNNYKYIVWRQKIINPYVYTWNIIGN